MEFTAQTGAGHFPVSKRYGAAGKFDGGNLQAVTDGVCFLSYRDSEAFS